MGTLRSEYKPSGPSRIAPASENSKELTITLQQSVTVAWGDSEQVNDQRISLYHLGGAASAVGEYARFGRRLAVILTRARENLLAARPVSRRERRNFGMRLLQIN